ncbi:hypothetical protein EHS25_009523 [Saitozyma podzolica]|uniref:Solute carrier family 40 member n=1 Tax=Saitozyma podzolica TaxID=1890683 RepID=A0A427YJG2_9TREE|nr:hypothetical protein EHS25_009523 [Saitozyma podzolica]
MYAPMSELRRSASVEVPAQIEFDEVEMGLLADQEEQRPLIGSGGDEGLGGKGVAPDTNEWAVACLLLQHVSSTFTAACYDFASFLFLIEVFKDTLVPASLVGLFTKLTGLLLSGYVGGLVDRVRRLRLVRLAIGAEKSFKLANYALFLVLFGPLRPYAQAAFHGDASPLIVGATWTILVLTVAFSSLLGLANTAMTVAIERDWVMTIARNDPPALTKLNTNIRRIDLLSKLIAPLFVSVLSTFGGYLFATTILLLWVAVTCAAEYFWIEVVYRRFPVLAEGEEAKALTRLPTAPTSSDSRLPSMWRQAGKWWKRERGDWAEFIRLPIFASSISIAVIYLTTLSYDGTFIAYIKAARGWDDAFIALMRGLCVVTGLIGTWVMPRLEKSIGLERAGAWSIWFEIGCLAPVMVSFFYGTGRYGEHGDVWNSVVLFGGIALSRIGLWSFDLCQLKELQLALDSHPHRNRLTALQLSLSNLFDLAKYALTLAASTPAQFKWTAVVSWLAVLAGGEGVLSGFAASVNVSSTCLASRLLHAFPRIDSSSIRHRADRHRAAATDVSHHTTPTEASEDAAGSKRNFAFKPWPHPNNVQVCHGAAWVQE